MSVTVATPDASVDKRAGGIGAVYRVEVSKIAAQLLPRAAAAICLVAPFAFTFFVNTQSSVPADSLFGRWIHSSGFAIPFIVLGFAGIAGFPLIASVVAGDIFASEDRQSTWKTVLTRSCSRGDVFLGKTLAALTFSTAMVALLAVSSTLAGVVIVGRQPLVDLSGSLLGPGRALTMIAASFGLALVPTLAFTCVGIYFSVVTRNTLAGVLGPPVIGLLMVLMSLMGSGVIVRSMLLTTPFDAWHGLQIEPFSGKPLWIGMLVCAAYAFLSLDAARRSFRRRDFAGDGQARLAWGTVARGTVVGAAVVAVLLAGSLLDSTWITSQHVETSVAKTLSNLIAVQEGILGHTVNPSAVRVYPFCKRESVISGASSGAGDDWTCRLFVDGPRVGRLAADYAVTVKPNGCYTADGEAAVIGPLHIKTPGGGTAINPLSAFDGCMISP
ncbi:MAG: type transport system permease protein [Actinomycetota bacterium]|jgi:ABC-2 type transport system permease protein|nr:type transport system permease protein [Actinomycetota bacterium]